MFSVAQFNSVVTAQPDNHCCDLCPCCCTVHILYLQSFLKECGSFPTDNVPNPTNAYWALPKPCCPTTEQFHHSDLRVKCLAHRQIYSRKYFERWNRSCCSGWFELHNLGSVCLTDAPALGSCLCWQQRPWQSPVLSDQVNNDLLESVQQPKAISQGKQRHAHSMVWPRMQPFIAREKAKHRPSLSWTEKKICYQTGLN